MQTSQDQVKPSQPSPPQPQTEEKQQLAPLPKQDALAEKQIENQTTPISGRAEDRVTVASDKVIFWALFRLAWGSNGDTPRENVRIMELLSQLIGDPRPQGVSGQAKVSVLWLQGSLFLGNLVVLFTAVVISAFFLPCHHLTDVIHLKMTLIAWYQLRQEHLMAIADTVENQGVIVQVKMFL